MANREWLSGRVSNAIASLNIEDICKGKDDNCGSEPVRTTVLEYVLRQAADQQRHTFERSGGAHSLLIDNASSPVLTIKVNDTVKAFLNHVYERANEDEAEFSCSGITAKVKKDSEGKLTIDGDIEWVREGKTGYQQSFRRI